MLQKRELPAHSLSNSLKEYSIQRWQESKKHYQLLHSKPSLNDDLLTRIVILITNDIVFAQILTILNFNQNKR